MLKITIVSDTLRQQAYTNKKGLPAKLFFQTAYLHTVGADGKPNYAPEKFEFIADRNELGEPVALALGDFTLHPSAIQLSREGRIEVLPTRVTAIKRQA